MILRMVLRSALAGIAALFLSSMAQGALFRSYLDTAGSDANPCTLPAPCRLLPAALAAVASGGEIWMLDSGNYNIGPVNITKSVTILAVPGVVGSVVATAGGPAINVASADVKVVLRNLVIVPFPGGGGTNGINVNSVGAALTVENCVIANLAGNAIFVNTAASLRVTDTTIRGNARGLALENGARATVTRATISGSSNEAIHVLGSAAGTTTTADIADSTIDANSQGIYAQSINATALLKVSVRGSRLVRNTFSGALADSAAGASVTLSVSNNIISNNGAGIAANNPGSKVWASANTVSDNSAGLYNVAGLLESAGNNAVRNNTMWDTQGTITVVLTNAFTIGGTVSGLTDTVVLGNNGGDARIVSVNGAFAFAAQMANGSAYNVTVLTHPAGQTCLVANGTGTVSGTNVTGVTVTCTTSAPGDLETLPVTLDTVLAATSIWTGPQELEIPSSCGGEPAIACPGGVPTNPAPRLAMARASTSAAQTATALTYSFSSQVSLVSVTAIPVTIMATTCPVTVNTTPGASPTVLISGNAVFDPVVPLGSITRLRATNVVVTGLASEDISVGGGALCALLSGYALAILNSLPDLLKDMIESQPLCGAPGAPLFGACPL